MGWSVIPVGEDKKPLVKWKPYQERLPTEDEVRRWFGERVAEEDYPLAGIALICGSVSGGVYALDVDPRNGGTLEGKSLPGGPHSRTLHDGGGHYFFSSDIRLAKRQGILPGVDFQGERSIVVLPPPTPGYTWLEEPAGELPELPTWVIKAHRHP
ncbi:unnamed protein product, partial [marine sediment metagenome]